jgi:hypothetical protein
MSLDNVPLTVGRDEQTAPGVTDDNLQEAFRVYHNNVAQLYFVENTTNLAQASRNRLRPTRMKLGKNDESAPNR